jgi:hypothetical protein
MGCVVTAAVILCACNPLQSIQDSVEVRRGDSVTEKLEIATAVVNEQSLGKIRVEARRRVPNASEEELRRVALAISQTAISGKRPTIRITVIVSLREPTPEMGVKILQTCVQLVNEAVNGGNATWLGSRQ